jgi:hypothetical protein
MEGAGTHDLGLIFLIIDRCEVGFCEFPSRLVCLFSCDSTLQIDLGTIREVFPTLYGKNLVDMVREDTSGGSSFFFLFLFLAPPFPAVCT